MGVYGPGMKIGRNVHGCVGMGPSLGMGDRLDLMAILGNLTTILGDLGLLDSDLGLLDRGLTIMHQTYMPLLWFAALGSALTAGIFFTFSTFVMQALGQQSPPAGIATMQAINITVINPWFMAAFFGPALVGIGFGITTLKHLDQPTALYWIVGTLLYGVGTIGVTVLGNIPLNDALAVVNPHSAAGETLWARYLHDWTVWNHVRTVAAAAAAVMFTLALVQRLGLPS
jgi:uncharacterized membrane protein